MARAMTRRVEVALTGGIACGKSAAAAVLESAGVAVLDTDRVAHEVMAPGEPVYAAVVEAFGREILAPQGAIDRAVLGEKVFRSEEARAVLNALVHPAVRRRWRAWVAERRAADESCVVAIPLLFEAGVAAGWTAIVCVTAEDAVARERLRARGWTDAQARRRIAAQMPVEEKAARSDYVIANNGTLEDLKRKVLRTWREIRQQGVTGACLKWIQ